MPFRIDVSKVADWETLCVDHDAADETTFTPIVQALASTCMFIGINQITEDNVVDFAERTVLWERLFGTFLVKPGPNGIERQPLTVADIVSHIGLTTNATPRTRAAFDKNVLAEVKNEATQSVRSQANRLRQLAAAS